MKHFALFFIFYHFSYSQETILVDIYGDLDNDTVDERVVVKELNEKGEQGKIRELSIYKKINADWKLLTSCKNAIQGSESGGMMGDAFSAKDLTIKKGILIINHSGGSSWIWNTTHKYRFQNNTFQLIGYQSSFGKICESWEEFDYNLSTDKIIYTKTIYNCTDDGIEKSAKTLTESFCKKLTKRPDLQTINTIENKITTPKYNATLVF